jgi:hypothetical protein
MVSAGQSAPHPVVLATLHTVSGIVSSRRVTSLTSRAYEWSVVWCRTVELDCNALSARFAGYDDAACPHVLQAHDGSSDRCLGNMRACHRNTRA